MMTHRNKWILVSAAVLVGGYAITRIVYALLLTLGIVSAPRAHAKATLNLGPYPLEIAAPEPQDTGLSWYDPAKTVKRVQEANAKPQALKEAALKEGGGDGVKAAEALLAKSKEPDAAEALFQLMAELAPQVPGAAPEGAPKTEGAPSQIGIHAVAKVAETLKARYGTKEMGHFDSPLMERAILLMAYHGAPDIPGMKKVPLADGSKEVPPIDPVVRATLRALLKGDDLQILAARALGQLGDVGTAKEIMDHPGRYPGASIADFGPGAVEAFKQKRLKDLRRNSEGFDTFAQGMRLTPKYQDTAIDLALAGDAGAGMAMQRNFMVGIWNSEDQDSLMASYFDMALRFHGTRTAFIGEQGAGRWDMVVGYGPRWRKSNEMMLRIVDHDLNVVFNTKGWREDDLIGMVGCAPTVWWHEHKYRFHIVPGYIDMDGFDTFYESIEKLFKKYYKKTIYPDLSGWQNNPNNIVIGINRYARHLGLDVVDASGRELFQFYKVGGDGPYRNENDLDPIALEKKNGTGRCSDWQCINLGHLKEGEKL